MALLNRIAEYLLITPKAVASNWRPLPGENELLQKRGHRLFVGGEWDKSATLQFKFMVDHGLKPDLVFLDIACGALRAGRLFISYLDAGNYLGIDKNVALIEAGVNEEIPADLLRMKRPELIASDRFEFDKFSKRPAFCLAQSLFSHLSEDDIKLCLMSLCKRVTPGCRFFATFFEIPVAIPQIAKSHSNRRFSYTRKQMEAFGRQLGWESLYVGDWGHPTQKMIEFVKR